MKALLRCVAVAATMPFARAQLQNTTESSTTPSAAAISDASMVTGTTLVEETVTINASMPWLPTNVPVQSFLLLNSCASAWDSYSSQFELKKTTTSSVAWTTYETYEVRGKDSPVITLCDGIPRDGIYTVSTTTSHLTSLTEVVTSWDSSGIAVPTCSFDTRSCSNLWSLYERSTSYWSQTQTATDGSLYTDPSYWRPGCSVPDSCDDLCVLQGQEEVDLYYWPVPPGQLSSLGDPSSTALAKSFDFADLAKTTVSGFEIPLVPSSAYWYPHSCDGVYVTACAPSTVQNDYKPQLLYRTQLTDLQPAWSNCVPLRQHFNTYAMHDPPIALTTAGALLPNDPSSSTKDAADPTSNVAAEPSQPVSDSRPSNTSPATTAAASRSNPTTRGDPPPTDPADPSSGVDPAGSTSSAAVAPADPTPSDVDPASSDPGESVPRDGSSSVAAATATTQDPSPSVSAAATITLGGSTYTALPGQDLTAGSTVVSAGQVVSVGIAGVVVVDGHGATTVTQTYVGVAPAGPSAAADADAVAVVTIGSQTLAAVDGTGLVVGGGGGGGSSSSTVVFSSSGPAGAATSSAVGVVLSVGGPATVIGGHGVSLASSGVVVVDGVGQTLGPAGTTGAVVVTIGGVESTLGVVAGAGAGSGVAGGGAASASWSSEVVFTIGTGVVTAVGSGGSAGVVVVGTLTVGGAAVTTAGEVLSAASDGVVVNGTTTESLGSGSSSTKTGSDGAASSTTAQIGTLTTSGGIAEPTTTSDSDQGSGASALKRGAIFFYLLTLVVSLFR